MKKNKLKMMIVMIGILVVVSACGNAIEEKQLESGQNVKQENGNSGGLQSETTNAAFNANFEKGVFLDFSKENDPFLNEQIKGKLKKTLEAQTSGDKEAFRNTFQTPETGDAYLGVIGDYKFTDIGLVQKDTTKNQILVEVQGKLARETTIDSAALTYYFASDTDGNWSLVAID